MDQGVLLSENIGQFGRCLEVDSSHTSKDGVWRIDEWHIEFRVRVSYRFRQIHSLTNSAGLALQTSHR